MKGVRIISRPKWVRERPSWGWLTPSPVAALGHGEQHRQVHSRVIEVIWNAYQRDQDVTALVNADEVGDALIALRGGQASSPLSTAARGISWPSAATAIAPSPAS